MWGLSDTFAFGFHGLFRISLRLRQLASSACLRHSVSFSRPATAAAKRHCSSFLIRHVAPMSPLQPTSAAPSLGFPRFGLVWLNGSGEHRRF